MKSKSTIFSILVCLLCFFFNAKAQQSPACTAVSQDGYYSYKITQVGTDTYMTFIPAEGTTTGSPTLLFFYGTSPTGTTGANSPVPNTPFKLTSLPAAGTPVYFYFVYSSPAGQKDNAANRHSFIVGDCSDSGTPNIKPEITLLPAVGGPFTAPASVLLRANATDQDGTITKVEFYNGAVKIGEATSGNADIYSIQWDNVQPGEYTITAKATDNKFEETISDPVTVTVGGEFTNNWCGTSVNGDYQWKAETTGNSVKFTIHPAKTVGTGINNPGNPGGAGPWAIIYPYGVYMTKVPETNDLTYTATGIASGTNISFYVTYNFYGPENNTSANKESYIAGTQCAKTLPVSLIDFNSKTQSDGTVSLSWATASESNNSYFLIERSADGKNFSKLEKVPSKDGNSTARLDYQFTDKQPLNGNNYYRLSQFDKNGQSAELGLRIERISGIAQSNAIYPNPLTGTTLNIAITAQSKGEVIISITNLSGQEIYRGSVSASSGSAHIQLPSKLASGVYLVKVGDQGIYKLLID